MRNATCADWQQLADQVLAGQELTDEQARDILRRRTNSYWSCWQPPTEFAGITSAIRCSCIS